MRKPANLEVVNFLNLVIASIFIFIPGASILGASTSHDVVNQPTAVPTASDYFITTWQTLADGETITIPTIGSGYNYSVDWGDGTSNTYIDQNATHNYVQSGTYTVKISGDFPRIYFNNTGDKNKILTIEQWGTNPWISMASAFAGCGYLELNATDAPDLSNVTDMSKMFYVNVRVTSPFEFGGGFMGSSDRSALNADLNGWDVSNVTNMEGMFHGAKDFNSDLSSWDVSNVTNMSCLFLGSGFNSDISMWDVSRVTDMSSMFFYNRVFNQDISNWDISKVKNMSFMFSLNEAFNHDLSTWDVHNVTDMKGMFYGALSFNQDIGAWDVSKVTDMEGMFDAAIDFDYDLSNWNVDQVTNMNFMFYAALEFNSSIGNWDLNSGVSMERMLDDSGMTCENYSATLIGWANQTSVTGVQLGASGLAYGTNAESAAETLIVNRNWTITPNISSGEDCRLPCPIASELLAVIDTVTLTCSQATLVVKASSTIEEVAYLWEYEGNILSNKDTVLISKPGKYYVSATQTSNGCTTTDSVQVIDGLLVPALVVPKDSILTCDKPLVSLTASSSTPGASISWEFEENTITDNTIDATKAGSYTAVATLEACRSTQSVTLADHTTLPELTTRIDGVSGNIGVLGCASSGVTLSVTTATPGAEVYWSVFSSGIAVDLPGLTEIPNITLASTFLATATNPITGCEIKDTVRILEDTTVPLCDLQVPATNLPSGNTVNVATTLSDRYNYSWEIDTPNSNWEILSGEETNAIDLFVGSSKIDLSVGIIDTFNKCNNFCEIELSALTSSAARMDDNHLPAEEVDALANAVDIYPNPSNQEQTTVEYTSLNQEQTTIKLYNLSGKVIQSIMSEETKDNHRYQFNLNENGELSVGTYRLEIITPTKTTTRLLIIR